MVFDTDEGTVFQIRPQHRNEEVREVIPADYGGVMVTDRAGQFGTKLKELLGEAFSSGGRKSKATFRTMGNGWRR